MKTRYVLGMIAVLIIATATCAYAAEHTIGDGYKFTMLDGYTMTEQDEDCMIFLKDADPDYVITVSADTEPISESELVSLLENDSYDVLDNKTIQYNGKDLIMVHYLDGDSQVYEYDWIINETYAIYVVYECPAKDPETDWLTSPGKKIFDSIHMK